MSLQVTAANCPAHPRRPDARGPPGGLARATEHCVRSAVVPGASQSLAQAWKTSLGGQVAAGGSPECQIVPLYFFSKSACQRGGPPPAQGQPCPGLLLLQGRPCTCGLLLPPRAPPSLTVQHPGFAFSGSPLACMKKGLRGFPGSQNHLCFSGCIFSFRSLSLPRIPKLLPGPSRRPPAPDNLRTPAL